MATIDDIIDRLKKANELLGGYRDTDRRRSIKRELDAALSELRALPEAQGRSIEEFFTAVGEGARSAQQQLDVQSALYMQDRPEFAPDTTFRIPTVSANLKLAMTETEGKKVGFLVYNKTKQSERLLEQEISFDIVATPPPPEAVAALADLPLGQVVATSDAERRAALEAVERARRKARQGTSDATSDTQVLNAIQIMTAKNDSNAEHSDSFRRCLVFPTESTFVLAYVLPKESRDATFPERGGAVLVVPRTNDGPLATTFGSDLTSAKKEARFAFSALAPLADRQAEMLDELGRP